MNQDTKQVIHSLFFAFVLSIGISIGVYFVLWGFVIQAESDSQNDEDFVRTVIGLECHQMERYILDMEYRWDKVIEYHSFKCSDSTSDYVDDVTVKGYDIDGNGDVDVDGGNGDVEQNDVDVDGGACESMKINYFDDDKTSF